ncbi:MAG: hypothetical protein ACODUE_13675 [Synechococcus sp.]
MAFDAPAAVEALAGIVIGLVALFSSYDHIILPGYVLALQQQWGVWLIIISFPLVLIDAQLAAGSRRRAARDLARQAARHARLDRIRNRLDRGRLAFNLDPSPTHRRELQRLLKLLASPQFRSLPPISSQVVRFA